MFSSLRLCEDLITTTTFEFTPSGDKQCHAVVACRLRSSTMQSNCGNLPESEVLTILNYISGGSLRTLSTMLPHITTAFPHVQTESPPGIVPLLDLRKPSPALLKALVAASNKALNVAADSFCKSSTSNSRLLAPSAAKVVVLCCSVCSAHMNASIRHPANSEPDRRAAQVQVAVAALASVSAPASAGA
jgi:hypothetical protein